MRTIKILIAITVIFYTGSCSSTQEPIYGTYYTFINYTGQKTAVNFFHNNGVIVDSFSLIQSQETSFSFSRIGNKTFPYNSFDSVHIIYNDTTKFVMIRLDERFYNSFLIWDNWDLVKQNGNSYYYEYIFTEQYYQEALDNGN